MNDLPESKAAAGAARARLELTVNTLRARMQPASLFQDGKELARQRAVKLAAKTIISKKKRSILALGAVVAGATYLLRKPIARALQKHLAKETDND